MIPPIPGTAIAKKGNAGAISLGVIFLSPLVNFFLIEPIITNVPL